MVTSWAGVRLSSPASLAITAETIGAFLIAGVAVGAPVGGARTLFVSEATVKTHVNRIFAKTGSRDRVQAMRYAYTRGYADPS